MAQMKVDCKCKVCGLDLKPNEDAIFVTKVMLTDEKSGYAYRGRTKLEGKLRVVHYGRVNPRFAIHVDCLPNMCK